VKKDGSILVRDPRSTEQIRRMKIEDVTTYLRKTMMEINPVHQINMTSIIAFHGT